MKITTRARRHSVVYSPNTQLGGEQGVGSWATHNVLTGTVRLNDAGARRPDLRWNEMLAKDGNDAVTGVRFTAGCANPVGATVRRCSSTT